MTRNLLFLSLTATLTACAVDGESSEPIETSSAQFATTMCASTCARPTLEDWETRDQRQPLWPATVRNVTIVTQHIIGGGWRAWGVDNDLNQIVFVIDGDEENFDDLLVKNLDDLRDVGDDTGQMPDWGILGTGPKIPPPPPPIDGPGGTPESFIRAVLNAAATEDLHGDQINSLAGAMNP